MKYKLIVITSLILISISVIALKHKTVYSIHSDPTGEYTVIRSYRSYLSLLPMTPGSSSDKKGFIKIINYQGDNLGEIPTPMLSIGEISWTVKGAKAKLLGEWNFIKGYCYYWDESGNHKIFVKGSKKDLKSRKN